MKARLLSIFSLLVGVALFIFLIRKSGTSEIISRVRTLGAGFFLILVLAMLRQFARTYAWLRCMSDDDRSLGFGAVWRARLAGDAMADLTAAGPVVGEPLKIARLKNDRNLSGLISALTVENLAYAISSCLMILMGALILLGFFALDESLKKASWLAIGLVTAILFSAFLILARRWRIVSKPVAGVFRLFKIDERRIQRIPKLENYVFEFYTKRTTDFFIVGVCELTFHALGVIEVFLTLRLMDYPVSALSAFILEAVNRVINIVFAFVPAMIGVDEAGTGLLTYALGLGAAAGVTLAIIRKARMIFWIGIGMILLMERRGERGN